jgi:uncharacterized protein (DUF1330 family)
MSGSRHPAGDRRRTRAGQAFREWAESPDYQRISEERHAGADTVVLLVQALPGKGAQ